MSEVVWVQLVSHWHWSMRIWNSLCKTWKGSSLMHTPCFDSNLGKNYSFGAWKRILKLCDQEGSHLKVQLNYSSVISFLRSCSPQFFYPSESTMEGSCCLPHEASPSRLDGFQLCQDPETFPQYCCSKYQTVPCWIIPLACRQAGKISNKLSGIPGAIGTKAPCLLLPNFGAVNEMLYNADVNISSWLTVIITFFG